MKFGTLCLYGGSNTTTPATTIEYLREIVNGVDYYRFRVTFDPGFVDNTYGTGAIGWSPRRGHTFRDLYVSDHSELQLYDAQGNLKLHFKIDYVSQDADASCGYGSLGVKGGDGAMIMGNPDHILAVTTSSDRALNGCGYCMSEACGGDCRVNSPKTDANYTTNPLTPHWDFRMVYEVWVAADAFGASGFGEANISYVHASPAKTPEETITVKPADCPPNWEVPYNPPSSNPGTGGSGGAGGAGGGGTGGGGNTGGTGGTGESCPKDQQLFLTSEGANVCTPIPTGMTCPPNWTYYLTSEGESACVPVPTNGTCPMGYKLDLASEGQYCI